MRVSAIDECILVSPVGALPMRLEQKSTAATAIARALMALPIVGLSASLLAVAAVAIHSDPAPVSLLLDKPEAAFALISGLAVTVGLVVHPILNVAARIGRSRTVEISAEHVTTIDLSPFGRCTQRQPITNFVGLAHHIRSSLSGVRHEIVLVHSKPSRSVLLSASPKVLQSELDRLATDLRLPIVPASAIYARAARQPSSAAATAVPEYQALAA